MTREKATELLQSVLAILAADEDEPVRLVSALYVFGYFARGAVVVGDNPSRRAPLHALSIRAAAPHPLGS